MLPHTDPGHTRKIERHEPRQPVERLTTGSSAKSTPTASCPRGARPTSGVGSQGALLSDGAQERQGTPARSKLGEKTRSDTSE